MDAFTWAITGFGLMLTATVIGASIDITRVRDNSKPAAVVVALWGGLLLLTLAAIMHAVSIFTLSGS